MRYHGEFPAGRIFRIQSELYPVEHRTGNLHLRVSRTGRMYPGSGKDIPCRHLAGVIIPDKAFHPVTVCVRTDEPGPFLGLPRLAEAVEQERDEVDRLVGVVVILVPEHVRRSVAEEIVQV